MINEAFVRRYLPRGRAIGIQISDLSLDGKVQSPLGAIVGVVGDVRDHYAVAPHPMIYTPFAQNDSVLPAILLVRAVPGVHVGATVAAAIPATDPLFPAPTMRDLTSYMSDDAARARLGAITLGTLGVLRLLLAIAGIYAVVSYGVAQRTHEIGVRMALGARARHTVQHVVGGTLGLAMIGVLCGIVVGAFAVRLVADQLYGVGPYDPLTFGIVILTMTVASIAAALIPARRATHVDPIAALRYE